MTVGRLTVRMSRRICQTLDVAEAWSPGGSIRLVRRRTEVERQTVMRRYQRARRVLPAVAGGMRMASHARKGDEGPSPGRG